MRSPLLELHSVEKRFRGAVVLRDLSYSFEDGRRYALMGANGSGKTTLLNVICGLLPCDSGQILYKGHATNALSTDQLAKSGVARTFQSVKLFRSLTVEDNILVALRNKPDESFFGAIFGTPSHRIGAWRDRVEVLLTDFHLEGYRSHPAGKLSFGEQKLLQFAMATANPFDLLLLDEPIASLESKYADEVLHKLKAVNKTIIVVEHHPEFIRRLDAEVLFLAEGRIVATGSLEEVLNDPLVRESYL